MTASLRKIALTLHVVCSVGWVGAVAAFLSLAIVGLSASGIPASHVAYGAMEMIAWFVIVPAAFAALGTGVVQSLITPWGLVRHYWVLAKLVLTVGATALLLLHMGAVSRAAEVTSGRVSVAQFGSLQTQLVADAALGPCRAGRGHCAVGV